ncbi:caspase a-like [Myxocyprinus asiaticus]|uniref:caspase a-like n=1 Tax=Myxocyprinus asiaticus TaxID=70543 RepID=UPI002222716F|nr:caspase a-like [Myxocyprinus asiaticus]
MEKTIKDRLIDVFDDLGEANQKKFKNKLCDRQKEPRVRRSATEKAADSIDLADLMVTTFTSKDAVSVSLEILEAIGCREQAAELREVTSSPMGQHSEVDSKSQGVLMPVGTLSKIPAESALYMSDDWQKPFAVTRCSQEFRDRILREKGEEIYKPADKSVRKRLALLINNTEFDSKGMNRRGAEKDEVNMEWLLNQLDYQVVKHRNLSGKEMDHAVKSFAGRKEHLCSDSTFVVIMSHGKMGAILGVHYDNTKNPSDIFPVDNIFSHLNAENCAALRDKPKVILIQACRGGKHGRLWVNDSEHEEPVEIEEDDWVHTEKDFIPLMSCTPDTKSYRHVVCGTFYVQCLVDVFSKCAHEDHIEELFRKVMRCFENVPHMTGNFRQMVCKDRATLAKLFYLFPGL